MLLDLKNDDVICNLLDRLKMETGKSYNVVGDYSHLLVRWYNSLDKNQPDYTVYSDDDYITELWLCWKEYSKPHLRNIRKNSIYDYHKDDSVIVDLGCGFGLTTAVISEMFPYAKVYGTNLPDTDQIKVASSYAKDYDFSVIHDVTELDTKDVDLVFASEYFEHFENPIEHLDHLMSVITPKAMLIANAFGTKAIGHFDYYKYTNSLFGVMSIDAKSMSKMFNNKMREYGYEKQDTTLWNNRPAYWVKLQ